jgi:hypothetical protein
VDDTTLFLCDQLAWLSKPPTQRELFVTLRKEAQIWERLLWSSGGLLEIDKCRHCTIQWKFGESGKAKLTTKAEMHQPPFMLTTGDTGAGVRVRQLCLVCKSTVGARFRGQQQSYIPSRT